MIGILFLCLISSQKALSQNILWTVGTSVPKYYEDLKLTCTVSSNCCGNSARIWTVGSTRILNNGESTDSNKYVEEYDGGSNGFHLIIKNLQIMDVNMEYDCSYSLFNYTATLTQNDTWEFPPPEQCPPEITSDRGNDDKLEFTFNISRVAPVPSYFVLFGDENMTSDLALTSTNVDTWFYSLQCSMYGTVNCHNDQDLSLGFITGTKTTTVCKQVNLCYPCWKCGLWYYLFSVGAVLIVGPILIFFIYLICFRCCDSDSWQIRQYICFKDEDVADGNKYILYGTAYGKKKGWRAILRAVVLTLIGHTVFFSLLYPLLSVGTYCPTCKGLTEIAAIVFGLGGSMFCINFYVALLISREETSSCLQWLYGILIMVLVNLIFPLPFLIFYYYLKGGDTLRSCKKALFFIGCVLLTIICFPIPLMIIYYNLKKSFKYVKANIGSNVELPSPYKDANGEVTWSKINGKRKIRYSKGTEIEQSLLQELGSRILVKGGYLCISDVKESDEGIYECLTLRDGEAADPEVSKLQLIVSYGGNTQSAKSGSSCWPPCRVDQDPETRSHAPVNVGRSSERPTPNKEKGKKPVARVSSQPQTAHHVKTENTASAVLSTEKEPFKPRPLPNIVMTTETPRPLPMMPPGTQQEKASNKLDPIETTAEKKKKKKRRKKEIDQTKQTDVENSTEL